MKVMKIEDAVTEKHLEVCKCHECKGKPTKAIVQGTLITYSCEKCIAQVKEFALTFAFEVDYAQRLYKPKIAIQKFTKEHGRKDLIDYLNENKDNRFRLGPFVGNVVYIGQLYATISITNTEYVKLNPKVFFDFVLGGEFSWI